MRNSPHGGLWDQKLIKWLGLIRNSNDPIEAIAVIGTPLELNHPTRKKVGPLRFQLAQSKNSEFDKDFQS